jgi:DNA-binding transcriptional LysR family regulator
MRRRAAEPRAGLLGGQAFVEVARAGSHAAAARRLRVTPSAVSHALRKLQDSAGRELLEKRGRRLAWTSTSPTS